MDVDANLAELHAITARILEADANSTELINPDTKPDYDTLRLAELAQALDEWLTKGGFLPRQWQPRSDK